MAALAATIGMTWLAAGTQFSYFATLAVAGYGGALALLATDVDWRARARASLGVGAGLLLGLGVAAPLLAPGLAVRSSVLRDAEPVSSMAETHLPPGDLLRVVVPEWRGGDGDADWRRTGVPEFDVDTPFVGVTTVVLAVAAVVSVRRRRDVALAFAATIVVVVLAFSEPLHRLLYEVVPSYDQFRVGGRWIAVLPGFAAPLAAVGLTALLERGRAARNALVCALAGGAAVLVFLGTAVVLDAGAPQRYLGIRVAVAAVPLALVGAALLPRRVTARFAVVLLGVAVCGEAVFHTGRWYGAHVEAGALPSLDATRAATASGGRIVRLSPARTQIPPLAADVPLFYGAADVSGWAVIFPRDYDRYLRIIEDHGDFAQATNVAPPLTKAASLASPLLDALDARVVLVDPGVTEDIPSPSIGADGPVRVLERAALGPAALVPIARRTSEAEMWRRVADPAWRPDASAAVEGLPRDTVGGPGSVTRVARTADTEQYRVDAPQGGLLRVSGRFDEGWTARVDGLRVPVYRADGIFRSAVVPPGVHTVEWRYRNPAEERGRRVALAALAIIAALVAIPSARTRRTRRATPTPA